MSTRPALISPLVQDPISSLPCLKFGLERTPYGLAITRATFALEARTPLKLLTEALDYFATPGSQSNPHDPPARPIAHRTRGLGILFRYPWPVGLQIRLA